jgi:SHS2 domain-containing protein
MDRDPRFDAAPAMDERETRGSAARLAATLDRVAYFNHDADIGIIGRGPTIEAAFVAAAEAVFAVMTDLTAIQPVESLRVAVDEPDPELALVTWLNRLLAEARASRLALGSFALDREGAHWNGVAQGEPWRDDLDRGVEVKGATLTELAVRQEGGVWEARCVVDV